MASSEPKKKTSKTTAEKPALAPRRARGRSVPAADAGGPVPPPHEESATTRTATEGGQAPASAAETVETHSEVSEQYGWRTTRTRRTTTSEAKTVEQVLASQMSNSPKVSLYAQLAEFGAALLILRLVLPRLHGDSVSGALLKLPRRLKQRFGAAPVTEATEHADLSHISAAQVLGLTDVDAESRHLTDGLKVAAVSKSFGPLHVLRDVHFEIRPGEVVGILGPNGAGKTTLCNLISGLEAPSSGLITLDGADVTHLPARKRSAAGFGRSFQAPRLFPSLTLMQNLMLGSRQIEETAADRALASMAIPHSSTRRGDDSQFFARRLTEVLKASLQAESLLILDEPLAGLTSEEHDIVLGMARQKAQDGACVLIVEHLIPVLAPAVDRIVVLHEGRIIADGKPATVLKDEAVVEAYLGSAHEMEETTHE